MTEEVKHLKTINDISQNSNTVDLQDTNFTKEFNTVSSHVQNSDDSQITQQSLSLEGLNVSVNKSNDSEIPQNFEATVNLQDNVLKESNTKNNYQQQNTDVHFAQQSSSTKKLDDNINASMDKTVPQNTNEESTQNNDDIKEVNADLSHEELIKNIPSTQDLPKLEKNSVPTESTNKLTLQVTDTVVDLKDHLEGIEKFNETEIPTNTNIVHTQGTSNVVNQLGDKNDVPLLKEKKLEIKNESDIVNVLPNNASIANYTEKQPYISNNIISSEGYIPVSPNTSQNENSDVESITSMLNNGSVGDNTTHSAHLSNETENISSTQYPTVGDKENGCSDSLDLDSTPKYDHENINYPYTSKNKVLPTENVQETLDFNNKEKSNEVEPKSLVSSFGHPDACSGISCLNFKRNVDKSIKFPHPVPKQVDQDLTSHSINTVLEEENKNIINEITDQSDEELNFLDQFQNWLSSPTLNSLSFLSHIFGKDSSEHNGK